MVKNVAAKNSRTRQIYTNYGKNLYDLPQILFPFTEEK